MNLRRTYFVYRLHAIGILILDKMNEQDLAFDNPPAIQRINRNVTPGTGHLSPRI
jgi:hypothetical protein